MRGWGKTTDESHVGLVPAVGLETLSPKYADSAEPRAAASDPSESG